VLLAEIHGKTLEVARDNEDYLTSAVFGHLRYVAPGLFWDELLKRAKGLPGPLIHLRLTRDWRFSSGANMQRTASLT
jgi:hypothetical protein